MNKQTVLSQQMSNRFIYIIICILLLGVNSSYAQEIIVEEQEVMIEEPDTVIVAEPEIIFPDAVPEENEIFPDSVLQQTTFIEETDSLFLSESLHLKQEAFKPSSTKAIIYSAIFPGLGQIYNRKYWKLPLVYGGFMGFVYAITWNNGVYKDYYEAYMDVMDDAAKIAADPEFRDFHESWQSFISSTTDPASRVTQADFQNSLKRKKDYFRRYRDLSIILAAGFYFICMIDAYVDAELFNFDISEDLAMRVEPMVVPKTAYSPRMVGLNLSITF